MLLHVKNLSVAFPSEKSPAQKAVDQISFTVEAGKTVALVGESGSGKSVTALSILGLHEAGAVTRSGEILFEGRDLCLLPEKELRHLRGNRIAMIFQEPMTSLNPVYTIGAQLLEPLTLHRNLTRHEAEARAVELLARTGIPDPERRLHSFPHQLSGGQRQRVMLAMALAGSPALLIADEPTTALDVTIQAQILDLLRDLQQEMGMAILLITHDLVMVKKIAEQVLIMHEGHIVEQGETEKIFTAPENPYTINLLESVPKGEPPPKPERPALLSIKNLECHFPVKRGFLQRTAGVIKAVDGVTLTIREGSTCGIVGESGSGKSTLGMCILRLTGCRGEIIFNGTDLLSLNNTKMRPLRCDLQVVFQDPYSSLSPRLTVAQIIGEGLTVHRPDLSRGEREPLIHQALLEVGLEAEMARRYPHEFSGGQRQRIAIARAIIFHPRFLVLDEPTSALDMTVQAQIIKLLQGLQEKYHMTYLFISHDLRVIRALADDVAVMQDGRIVEAGPASRIFAAPSHPYTKALFQAAFGVARQS